MPAGFSAQTLFQQYGFVLDDHGLDWTPDDAFKLHQTGVPPLSPGHVR